MKKATLLTMLLLSAVWAAPASANYFSNPRLGVNLNIGSAPNPKPADLRALYGVTESTTTYTETAQAPAPPPPPAPPPEPPPPPVAEALPPPPAPPPVPEIRQFMVFFDFDRSNITPEARQVIAEAVRVAKETGPVRITVTGHTDTVGSFRYNQALSERRARSVKNEMVQMGVGETDIATVGKSFSEPLVATGPGVREPQNRRAMIELGTRPLASLAE